MTHRVDSRPNYNIVDFNPKRHLNAEAQVVAFIQWAKETVPKGIPNRVYDSFSWEDESWHYHGFYGCNFRAWGSTSRMQPPFTDFAKAMLVYRCVYQTKQSASPWLKSLKALEAALVELTGGRDVARVSAAVCNLASDYMQTHTTKGDVAYRSINNLEQIITLMRQKQLLIMDFRWASPIKRKSYVTLKQQKVDSKKKLPNPEAIKALGEIFNNDLTSTLDIVVTSACALLLSAPSRVGELSDLELDCVMFKEDSGGNRRMFLRWYAEKLNKTVLKPVVKPEMEPVVERAIALLKPITDDGRAYAAWLEDNPDEFPLHERLPQKGPDDSLTYEEACAAWKLAIRHAPRAQFKDSILKNLDKRKALSQAAQAIVDEILEGWDNQGNRIYMRGKPGVQGIEFHDRCVITLRKLNVLMREKYLPKHFPYTTPYQEGKTRVKYRDALFTVRTGALHDETKKVTSRKSDFGVEIAANSSRVSMQLAGHVGRASIFQRYGYQGLKANTHSFRHELNTRMHQAGLSQLLIDAFSGRSTMGSVYNHETVEERTQRVADYHPKTRHSNSAQRLEKVTTNQPLKLSDVKDLHEGDQDRVIHQTHVGICVHNFAAEPCPKMGACLGCGKLGCVKGDDVKLANLKEEREDLQRRYDRALDAHSRDVFGASEWIKKIRVDLIKCDALIRTLENPAIENGDIVWNVDNGWTLTKNAAAMVGLIDAGLIEGKNELQQLQSLDDLSAMLDEFEVK
ncbi:MAG: hypothetical protein Q7U82_06720 [Gammaproteobacteria bacterium]|nr:hypothetical protein [Gammaproteobacteria bacterium]